MTTVVVGAGSMIARALRRHPDAAGWLYLPHQQALTESGWVRDARVVINLAFDPRLKTAAYDPALDVDRRLAAILAPSSCAYIMVSTRMAYGPPGDGLRLAETMPSNPVNYYGTAKLAAERHLLAAQGDRVTVLRLSNIFDPSEAAGERRSFFGMAMRTLAAQGRIIYDMSPFVARDFLPADLLAERLVAVAAHRVVHGGVDFDPFDQFGEVQHHDRGVAAHILDEAGKHFGIHRGADRAHVFDVACIDANHT